ncbi:hypothetical protein L2E82_31528 [Cichorium intybus]|uniref:Uncharacterized protein n=1 Tax=Cichorium intybus TaxID=13427 RepID=A0ACB9BFH9_CICIN|nr:hypothetical protein L2E82_31528 [Cichorium intybus]
MELSRQRIDNFSVGTEIGVSDNGADETGVLFQELVHVSLRVKGKLSRRRLMKTEDGGDASMDSSKLKFGHQHVAVESW